MARVAVLIVCAALLAQTSARAHPPPILTLKQEKAFADEIIAWRKEFAAVAGRRDATRLRDLYAPSFVHTDDAGEQVGRDARIKLVLKGEPVIELAPADGLVIRVPGGWTAIATARSALKSADDGKTYRYAWTAVYVRAGDGWQLAASHATRLEEVVP
jgi:ketosteroid isomerase-like protein